MYYGKGWIWISNYDVIVVGAGPAGCSAAISCANLGMKVLLLERWSENSEKPCGGVLPWIASDVIESVFDAEIPDGVLAMPSELGLYYVPPSGAKNGGAVKDYRIHNIKRAAFDQWLRERVAEAGVTVRYNSRFISFHNDLHTMVVEAPSGPIRLETRFVIGADGVRSRVRSVLFPNGSFPVMLVGQEYWTAEADLGNYFYGFFRGDLSPSYAYVIPKDNNLILGLGVLPRSSPTITEALAGFKDWLVREFSFRPQQRVRREMWAIPFGFFQPGRENVLLIGDAAGLCNPLSGEGIRLAIESGEYAATALQNELNPLDAYIADVNSISDFVLNVYAFVTKMNDDGREQFVREELARRVYFA